MAKRKKVKADKKEEARDEVFSIFKDEARDDSRVRDILITFSTEQSHEKFPVWVRNHVEYCRKQVKCLKPFADGKMSKLTLQRFSKELDDIERKLNSVIDATSKDDVSPFNFHIVDVVSMHYEPLFQRIVSIRATLNFLSLKCLGIKFKKPVSPKTASTVPQPVAGKEEFEFDMYK